MTAKLNNLSLAELAEICPARLHSALSPYLRDILSIDLKNAMEYTMFSGGKHLRPMLIYATGDIFNAPIENLDVPACAVELIHTYSLIHDDLPCMDNADLRRGKPTCHKIFGEAIAVLTGDALHSLAMQIIASHPAKLNAEKRNQMLNILSYGCGSHGMAGGQGLDITLLGNESLTLDLLLNLYRLKTGALITASIELGRIASGDDDENNQRALREFGDLIGLAFQIQDDILDIEASTEILGKPQGIDVANKKMTYPKIVGMTAAKDKVNQLYQEALEAIDYLGHRAQLLRDLTSLMLKRKK